jgi:hypothetical protein
MVADGLLPPPGLLEPALKALQDRLARELDRSGSVPIPVSRIRFRHRIALLIRWREWASAPAVLLACPQAGPSSAAKDFLRVPRRWAGDGRQRPPPAQPAWPGLVCASCEGALRIRQKAVMPASLRKVPAIFCWTLTIRRSRSAWLFVNGMDRSSRNASTWSARRTKSSSRFLLEVCLRLPRRFGGSSSAGSG